MAGMKALQWVTQHDRGEGFAVGDTAQLEPINTRIGTCKLITSLHYVKIARDI